MIASSSACREPLTLGEWTCGDVDGAVRLAESDAGPISAPWSTGFESRFCDYTTRGGFCYADDEASYSVVSDPVHSGRHAAAFKITGDSQIGRQTRCVRQGMLPAAAYYGAWYLIPQPVAGSDLWNLWHFRGGDDTSQHGLWDISLVERSGTFELVVYDFLNARTHRAATPKPVPFGRWFHIELYLKRANDRTGEIALYQDGEKLIAATALRTDDSSWGQWYVGNLAEGLTSPGSTLFVDDITIRASR
ncbi:MAG: hypothetical protein ABW321_21130 [Polyangiales bacterium]